MHLNSHLATVFTLKKIICLSDLVALMLFAKTSVWIRVVATETQTFEKIA